MTFNRVKLVACLVVVAYGLIGWAITRSAGQGLALVLLAILPLVLIAYGDEQYVPGWRPIEKFRPTDRYVQPSITRPTPAIAILALGWLLLALAPVAWWTLPAVRGEADGPVAPTAVAR